MSCMAWGMPAQSASGSVCGAWRKWCGQPDVHDVLYFAGAEGMDARETEEMGGGKGTHLIHGEGVCPPA